MKRVPAVVVVLFAAAAFLRAQSASDLFQKALSKERVDGQLTEAIALYERVVNDAAGDRPLAARALVQIGRCYERLGHADATKVFERVVREFADQPASAAEARARLAALTAGVERAAARVSARRLWAGDGVDYEGTLSADGRLLSFTDWSTGDVALRDLVKGTSTRLTRNGALRLNEYADFSALSPDGRRVAYAWANADGIYDLRLIGSDGSGQRVLVKNPELNYFVPHAWSPDQRHILTLFYRKDRTKQIALVAASDGSARILKSLDWREPKEMSFSPDGRWIAYDFPPRDDSQQRDIYLLATDASREVHLIAHAADDRSPFWSPDGKRLVFVSDRGSGPGIWSVAVADGALAGTPELVRPDVGAIFPLGLTRDGALYYALLIGASNVYLTALDADGARLAAEPALAASRFEGLNSVPAFSPSGEHIAYTSTRPPGEGLAPASRVLVVRSLASGDERVFETPISVGFEVEWSPDGGAVLSAGRDVRGRYAMFQVDVRTGATTTLAEGVSTCSNGCAAKGWFPGGKSVYFVKLLAPAEGPARTAQLMHKDLDDGAVHEIMRYDGLERWSFLTLSPDGQRFAGWQRDADAQVTSLAVFAATGGEPRQLLRVKDAPSIDLAGLAWSRDGRHLFYANRSAAGKSDLWRVAAAGGAPTLIATLAGRVNHLALHPDGRRLAYSTRDSKPEIWVMEHFLPAR